MSEYELYTRILAPRLRPEAQSVLIEKTGKKNHVATVEPDSKTAYTLYRYDQKEHGELFFPFFNNTHDGERGKAELPTPDGLLKFCDYILLAEKKDTLYVLLIEMKSGGNGDAVMQLDASATFMDFVKSTALRIAEANGYENFDADSVIVRKIVLKPAPNARPMTNQAKSKVPQVDCNEPVIYFQSNILPLYMFCRN